MRRRPAFLDVARAARYRLHDFRRGHANDLPQRGAGLGVVDASTVASFVNGTMHVLPTAYSSLDTFVIAATDGGARVGSLAGNGGVYVVDLNLQ